MIIKIECQSDQSIKEIEVMLMASSLRFFSSLEMVLQEITRSSAFYRYSESIT